VLKILSDIKKFAQDEEGATMVEYASMLSLIAILCIAAVALIGTNAKTLFNNIAGSITGS
jgi:pilus assembly protein Flp/PilA